MPVITEPSTWTHELHDVRFRSLATPANGTRENSIWKVCFAPGATSAPHSVTREEIFIVLSGELSVDCEGRTQSAKSGDAIVIPPNAPFSLTVLGPGSAELMCCLPVGGQARLADGQLITPPWAQ